MNESKAKKKKIKKNGSYIDCRDLLELLILKCFFIFPCLLIWVKMRQGSHCNLLEIYFEFFRRLRSVPDACLK